MSKKKNKKFKKIHRPEPNIAAKAISPASDEIVDTKVSIEKPADAVKPQLVGHDHDYSYVKKDIAKIGIVLIVLVAIFVGFYFLNTKTSLISSLGDWIYKISNFKI